MPDPASPLPERSLGTGAALVESMTRVRDLFPRLVQPDLLEWAARRTVRGKRRRPDVAWFLFQRERVLDRLRAELQGRTWRPGPLRLLFLRDPKPRVIARASLEDRIVQGALCLLLEPLRLRRTVAGDLACRPGGGTHRAWLRLLGGLRQHRFALHLDVRAYFPSIEPTRVLAQVESLVADRDLLEVLCRVLENGRGVFDSRRARRHVGLGPDWPPPGRGLPIGASTSQLFAAHLYLVGLDHFVTRRLRARQYVRYVDDLFLFGDRRADLRAWRAEIAGFLGERLELRLKHPQARVLSSAGHLDALGARITREGIAPLPQHWRRIRGLLGRHARGEVGSDFLRRSLAGRWGSALLR